MKKMLLWLLVVVFIISTALIGIGCKEEAAPTEEAVVEEVAEEEAAPVEEEAAEVEEEAEEVEPETINIGYIAGLSGPAAAWGLNTIPGIKIWVSEVNDAGGLNVNGKRYLLNCINYDSETNTSVAIEAVQKMIFEDNVKFVMTSTGPTAAGIAPLCTANKIVSFCANIFEASPVRPYMYTAGNNWPFTDSLILEYIAQNYPDVKNIAITGLDNYTGYYAMAMGKAFIETNPGFNLVYDSLFAADTVDYAPVISAILASEPDLVYMGTIAPDSRVEIVKQAYLQGAKPGEIIWLASQWYDSDYDKVPEKMLEGVIGSFPSLDDPALPEDCMEFYNKWHERFGPGGPEDENREMSSSDWLFYGGIKNWGYAVEAAGSFEGDAVMAALESLEPYELVGAYGWWGEELVGVNHTIMVKQFITEMKDGHQGVIGEVNFPAWLDKNIDNIAKWLEEYGQLWFQR